MKKFNRQKMTNSNQRMTDSNAIKITDSKSKKISYFATLFIVMGGCIGSGIFFKSGSVMSNLQDGIIMSLLSWLIAAIAVLAMAIAIVDIATQSKKDDRGFLSWTKRFNGLFLYRSSKNIYSFFILPIKFFVMPIYFFESLQSGLAFAGAKWIGTQSSGYVQLSQFGLNITHTQWWVILIIVLSVDLSLILINAAYIKFGASTNKFIMYLKFFPLIMAIVTGFVILGFSGGIPHQNHWWVDYQVPQVTYENNVVKPINFMQYSPAIGLAVSLAAIFFAFDGFYVAAGVQKQMKEPRRISSALFIGLLIVTCTNLAVSLSLTFGAKGGQWNDISDFFCKHNLSWLYCIMAVVIAIGVLGIANAYSMWSSRFYTTLIKDKEIPLWRYLQKIKQPWGGALFIITFSLSIATTFIVVGSLGYKVGDYDFIVKGQPVDEHVANLYNFCNMITNWQTLFSFTFITFAIISSTHKKLKLENKTTKNKIQIAAGIIAATIIMVAIVFQLVEPFADLGLTLTANAHLKEGAKPAQFTSSVALIVVLLVCLTIWFGPSIFEARKKKNQEIFALENKILTLELEIEELTIKKNDILNPNKKSRKFAKI